MTGSASSDGLKTFQQQALLGELERCLRLSYTTDWRGLTQAWQGVVVAINDYDGLDDDLRPVPYFRARGLLIFRNRVPIPLVRAYIIKVHQAVDLMTRGGLHR